VFKEVYSREVARAPDENKPVKWFRSFGYDKKARASQLEDAANRWPLPHLREAERLEHERQGLPENLRERITEVKRHLTHCEPPAKQHDRIQSIVENLPQDRQARKETIAALDTITRRKIEHELGERERERQLRQQAKITCTFLSVKVIHFCGMIL
jgi:hypothetical protein